MKQAFSIRPLPVQTYRGTIGDILDCHPEAVIYVRLPGSGKNIAIDKDDASNLHDETVIFTVTDEHTIFIH